MSQRRSFASAESQSLPPVAASWIFAQLNSLVAPEVIMARYLASQAGVPIDLMVRGMCCLRPGLAGLSENIRVRSIVDRFLEHSRIYIFGPRDECDVSLSSADWMPRNFHRRVEAMFPIEAPNLRERVLEKIAPVYLRDNVKARIMQSDGTHIRLQPGQDEPYHRCQQELFEMDLHRPAMSISPSPDGQRSGQARNNPPRRIVG